MKTSKKAYLYVVAIATILLWIVGALAVSFYQMYYYGGSQNENTLLALEVVAYLVGIIFPALLYRKLGNIKIAYGLIMISSLLVIVFSIRIF